MINPQDTDFMRLALQLAGTARNHGEVPVGALIVHENTVIAEAYNERETKAQALAHAEIQVIERACASLKRWRLSGCTLYVTLEPCVMCAGAVVQARIDRVVYGTTDPKAGGTVSLYQILSDPRLNHRPEVTGGILANECGKILSQFFTTRRGAR